jgi:hypothetical protein
MQMNGGPESYMPHGFCFYWDPQILVLLVSGDAIIAIAYILISWQLERIRTHLTGMFENQWLANATLSNFRNFIFACALTHVMHIVVIWKPWYLAQGVVNFITAALSLSTAVMCYRLGAQFVKNQAKGWNRLG